MQISLSRIMLFVQDVEALAAFYMEAFHFARIESIPGEWAVLQTTGCELALHRVGEAWRTDEGMRSTSNNNVKLVLSLTDSLPELRDALLSRGVPLGPLKSWPDGPLAVCEGEDPEGNRFQLVEVS